jgi:hypothetical protein
VRLRADPVQRVAELLGLRQRRVLAERAHAVGDRGAERRRDVVVGGRGVLDRVVEQRARHGEVAVAERLALEPGDHLGRDRHHVHDVRHVGMRHALVAMPDGGEVQRRDVPLDREHGLL